MGGRVRTATPPYELTRRKKRKKEKKGPTAVHGKKDMFEITSPGKVLVNAIIGRKGRRGELRVERCASVCDAAFHKIVLSNFETRRFQV